MKIKQSGFSLIELLVVMVIIGILSGIGIAQFKSQQKKAKRAKYVAEKSQSCKLTLASCVSSISNECVTFDECINTYPVNFVGTEYVHLPVPLTNVRKITFDFESKSSGGLLFFENRPSTNKFLISSNASGNLYHGNAVAWLNGGIKVLVDGVATTDINPFKNDGKSHAYEVSDFDISDWTYFTISGYSFPSSVRGVFSNLVFYDDLGVKVARYDFSDEEGTTISDVSGNGHHGTAYGINDETVFWGTD